MVLKWGGPVLVVMLDGDGMVMDINQNRIEEIIPAVVQEL